MTAMAERALRELDDLVLDLKGLVLVQRLRKERGADPAELAMYGEAIDRVRKRLASLLRNGRLDPATA